MQGRLYAKSCYVYRSNRRVKSLFSQYLIEIKGLKRSTAVHYLDALNTISRRLIEMRVIECSLYEDLNNVSLEDVKKILFADDYFQQLNSRGNHMYSCGFNHFCSFIGGDAFLLSADNVRRMDFPANPINPEASMQTIWHRSNVIKEQALQSAHYKCEIDKDHQSFIAERTGKPYMEGHHSLPMRLQPKFDYSLDVYANIVCLCPVCHRRIHFGEKQDRINMARHIYDDRCERLANSGIRLSKSEFVLLTTTGSINEKL